jgi:tRNA(adenine34) deaminase
MPANPFSQPHEYWIRFALREAEKAYELDEVPIGCIIIKDNVIIGKGYNQTEQLKDSTAHAEMIAITAACGTVDRVFSQAAPFILRSNLALCAQVHW